MCSDVMFSKMLIAQTRSDEHVLFMNKSLTMRKNKNNKSQNAIIHFRRKKKRKTKKDWYGNMSYTRQNVNQIMIVTIKMKNNVE